MSKGWLYAWGLGSVAFVGVPGALVFGRLADRTGKRRPFVFAGAGIVFAVRRRARYLIRERDRLTGATD